MKIFFQELEICAIISYTVMDTRRETNSCLRDEYGNKLSAFPFWRPFAGKIGAFEEEGDDVAENFTLLHISDLHFTEEPTSSSSFRNIILQKLDDEKLTSVDCVVISGDIFNRGFLGKHQALQFQEDFLKKLPQKDKILVVPGNHDLTRLAQAEEETEKGWNFFHTRKDLVLEKRRQVAEKGEFLFSNDPWERDVLYTGAFQGFENFAHRMKFFNFREPPLEDLKRYEVQCVYLPFHSMKRNPSFVQFVLLNTALIAGQSIQGEAYDEKRKEWEMAHQDALKSGDTLKAAELRLEIEKLQKFYRDNGELIVDDGEPMKPEFEFGTLSLSKEGNRLLSQLTPPRDVALTIFVGHHGFQLLSRETQKALKEAMRKCKSGIYLCGHAHEVRFKRFPIQGNSQPRDIEQFQAGRMFRDETELTQHGFNYASFEINQDGRLSGKVFSYFYALSPSEELQWHKEEITCKSIAPDAPPPPPPADSKLEEKDANIKDPSKDNENNDNKDNIITQGLDSPPKPPAPNLSSNPPPPSKRLFIPPKKNPEVNW